MVCWVCYDISDDKNRLKVSILCLEATLKRVQYSIYAGALDKTKQDELWKEIKPLINKTTDKCCIFHTPKQAFADLRHTGIPMDKKRIEGKVIALFF